VFVTEISDELAHGHEAAPGSDAKDDDRPNIGEIVEAIVTVMCQTRGYESVSIESGVTP
jgi:hypothetical protein